MKSIVSCNIRVEEQAWEKLRVIASVNKRSINKEIKYLIDKRIQEFEKENGSLDTKENKTSKK